MYQASELYRGALRNPASNGDKIRGYTIRILGDIVCRFDQTCEKISTAAGDYIGGRIDPRNEEFTYQGATAAYLFGQDLYPG
jgi:hypothetical protein